VASEWTEIDKMALTFGSTTITTEGDASLSQAQSSLVQRGDHAWLQLKSHARHAQVLRVDVAGVCVQGLPLY
jgi:hypothetical protein